MNSKKKRISTETCILILLLMMCVAPMAVNPSMIGIRASHVDQYEHLAESFVEGHIDLQYDYWDAMLFQLDNVYDYNERVEKAVFCQWDHAFYDSHYYMYFGVVPVLALFLPFRMLIGFRLPTFLATALFSSLFIIGMFRLFRLIKKLVFPELPERIRLLLSTAFSLAGMWYAMDCPTIYCLAITSALCLEIWSMYFYIQAVWAAEGQAESIRLAFLGALFGALAFGCRPTIALANVLAIPMFVVYLKKQKLIPRFWARMLYVISPYVVVGAALMYYNYIRFGTPFEFGQAYQLTVADQTAYGSMADNISWSLVISSLKENYFTIAPLSWNFPYVQFGGAFINFPVFALSIVGLFVPGVRKVLRGKKLLALAIGLVIMPVVITVVDALWVPWLTERYRMDFYWLMGIAAFLVCGAWYSSLKERGQRIFGWVLSAFGVCTMLACVVLYAIPYEDNLTAKSPLWLIILIMVSMTAWLLNICRLTGKADKAC
jgi:hypothetical protein